MKWRPQESLIFHRYANATPHTVLRVGDYKLIKIWKADKLELYNLKDDLGETTDLAAKLPQKTEEMRVKLMERLKQVDAEVLHGYGSGKKAED